MRSQTNLRRVLLGTTGIAAILSVAGAAQAQDVLETVIVTAEKTSTDIQKTSVSISAIQADTVEATGNTRLVDILQNVPSVQVNRGANTIGAYFIRGIGTTQGVNSTLEMVDGVTVNQISAEAMAAADASRVEVLRGPQGTLYGRGALGGLVNTITNDPSDRYEGKIFVGGGSYNDVKSFATINVPMSDDIAMRVTAFSEQRTGYMHPDGRGGTDIEGARGKLQYKPTDDFQFTLIGSMVVNTASGNIDALPQTTRISNWASPAFGGFNPCGGNPRLNLYDPWHSPAGYYSAFGCTVPAQPPVNPSPVTGVCQIVSRQENAATDVGFNSTYDFGWAGLTTLGNLDTSRVPLGRNGAIPFLTTLPPGDIYTDSSASVFEARLNSPASDALKWVGGFYWEYDVNEAHNINRVAVTGTAAPVGQDRFTRTLSTDEAAYGQVTVPVVDRLRVIAGLRYALDDVTQDAYAFNLGKRIIIGNKSNVDIPTHKLTYKAGLELDVTTDSMLYAIAATGYRPTAPASNTTCVGKLSGHVYAPGDASNVVNAYPQGGCTTAGAGAASVGGTPGEGATSLTVNVFVPPDSMNSYELGSKNRFLDNRLQIDIDAYYYKFQSLYISALGVNGVNQQATVPQAQQGTKAYGSELETIALITPNDRLTVGLAYEESETGQSPFNTPACYNFGTPTHPLIEVRANTTNLALCSAKNLAGNPISVNWVRYHPAVTANTPLFDAPTWTGNIGYQHIFDLSSGASVTAAVNVHFSSSLNTSSLGFYDAIQPAYHMTDLSVFYDTADGKWQLGAWVKNVENTPVNLGGQSNAGTAATGAVLTTMAQPRMWGVDLSAKF